MAFAVQPALSQSQQGGTETQSRSGETNQNSAGDANRSRQRGQDKDTLSDPDKYQGLRLGDFTVNPALSVSEYYHDNIFYNRVAPVEDFITLIEPSLSLNSTWEKHALNMWGGGTIGRYNRRPNEDYEDLFAGFSGHIDLGDKSRVFGGFQFNALHEGRESPDDVLGIKPTEYNMIDTYIGGQREIGAYGIRLGLTMQDYDYDDVTGTAGVINNDDRDRGEYELGIRVFRPLKKGVRLFTQAVFGKRDYDNAVDDFGLNRDSKGLGLAAGAIFKPRDNLSIEVLGGGLFQHYNDPTFSNIATPDFGVLGKWQPSPFTSVGFNLDRRLFETSISGSSGYISTSAGIDFSHHLNADTVLTANSWYRDNAYEQIDRTDHHIGFGTGGRYYLTPYTYGELGYRFTHRDSELAGADYFSNIFMLQAGISLSPHSAPAGLPSGFGQSGSLFAGVHTGHGTTFTALDGPRGGGTLTADFGDHGSVSGLFAGYDRFFGRWFLGAEADIEYADNFDWEHITTGDRIFNVKRNESYGLALRGGYRQPSNVGYYGRAGVLWTDFETNYAMPGSLTTRHDNEFGVRFGGGIEAPVTGSSGFVRMDYSYSTYEHYGINPPPGVDIFDNSDAIMRLGFVMRSGTGEATAPTNHRFDGFYLGTQLGYGGFAARNSGPRAGPSAILVDRASHGASGGLFAGYGFIPVGNIYLGVEGESELSYADWNIDRDPTGRVYDAQKEWTVGGSLRAGYLLGDAALLYGRAGLVASGIDTDYRVGAQNIDQKNTLSGLRFGAGLEVATGENIFTRMDYSYTAYEDYTVNYTGGPDLFKPTETLFRLGAGYRF